MDSVVHAGTPAYPLDWVERSAGELVPRFRHPETGELVYPTWAAQPGGQERFITATNVFEVLFHGNRGGGKTDTLIMDFAQHVGKGYGAEWRGILFRQTYPQLGDVIAKTLKWFKRIFPEAKYNRSNHSWTWPDGETLLLRHMNNEEDYWNYHGHAYPWIGWEELCNWPTPNCYTVMMSCCRSTVPSIPRCYRATTNPYGAGHNWVKKRFQLPHMDGRVIRNSYREGHLEPPRVAVKSSVKENRILLRADPDYISRIASAARNPAEAAAWLDGSWDIIAGGMFDDLWDANVHVLPSLPLWAIPKGWKLDRSFDWGSSRPFSVCWWAESNGEPMEYRGVYYGTVKGDLFLIREWYGSTGQPNEGLRMLARDIAQGIVDREQDWDAKGRVKVGIADASIFDEENGNNIAKDMKKKGVGWKPADKAPGSRKQGWEKVRGMLEGALPSPLGIPREFPGLFITRDCPFALELLPATSRDQTDLDDVDSDTEDHLQDAIRYRCRNKIRSGGMTEM